MTKAKKSPESLGNQGFPFFVSMFFCNDSFDRMAADMHGSFFVVRRLIGRTKNGCFWAGFSNPGRKAGNQ